MPNELTTTKPAENIQHTTRRRTPGLRVHTREEIESGEWDKINRSDFIGYVR